MSAVKWATIAVSMPFFQYSQPNATPAIPFKIKARATTAGVSAMSDAVKGKPS